MNRVRPNRTAMRLRIETAALDVLTLRLFDSIEETNMPWLIAAGERLREHFAEALIDLVKVYEREHDWSKAARVGEKLVRERPDFAVTPPLRG